MCRSCGDEVEVSDEFNEDYSKRYQATRIWDSNRARLTVIMANPTPYRDGIDNPTTRNAAAIACHNGYGGVHLVNIDARVSVQKLDCLAPDERNDLALEHAAQRGDDIWIAWGGPGAKLAHEDKFTHWLARIPANSLWCIGLTKAGEPKHPARKAHATELEPYAFA